MNEPSENPTTAAHYRFLDPVEDASVDDQRDSITVDFYPAIDDFVHIAEVNRKAYTLPWRAKYALQIFLFVNLAGLPAILWFFNLFFAGGIVLAFNIAMALIFLPATLRTDYRRFFQSLYGNIENEIVKIRLDERGISCDHLGDTSFHRWRNVRRIEETADAIFFFLINGKAIAVRKSGFAYDNEKNRFLLFAREQIKALLPYDASNPS